MGTSAQDLLSSLTPALLGMAGVCAAIALVMALMRHLLYEHGNDDLQPASKRVTHVFGFLAAIGFVAGAGSSAATQWSKNQALNPAAGGGGSSLLPSGIQGASSYSNIGDLIMANTNPDKKEFIEVAGDAVLGAVTTVAGAVAEADPSYQLKVDSLEKQKECMDNGDVAGTILWSNNQWSGWVP